MNLANIQDLYDRCMSPGKDDRISARTLYDYMISPFMVYCRKFGPEDQKDPITEYMELLFEQGKNHETNVIETNYPEAKKLTFATREEGFRLLLDELDKGARTLIGMPVFYLPECLVGEFDVLERCDTASSVFGDYHYTVKEIKLAKNIQKHHVMQAAFYNYLIGKIQGYTPPSFYLINRDHDEFEIKYNEEEVLGILDEVREIHGGRKVTPTYGACQWPWETYNNEEAIRLGDVSLVSGVGPSFKAKLVDVKIHSVDDLVECSPGDLTCIKGIGVKTAQKFLNSSRALNTGEPIHIDSCTFPQKTTEIFLDLEGTGEQMEDEELVAIDYLIGVLIRKDGEEEYKSFVAHDLDKEGEMFTEFIDWLEEQEDFIIYHWHSYEKTHLTRLAERHGSSEEQTSLLFGNMRDLYKDAVNCFAFPTYGNGLKHVAKFMGYKWKHADVDAMESIAYYFQYTKDPKANADLLQRVIDYNKDDCQATKVVKYWLEKNLKEL